MFQNNRYTATITTMTKTGEKREQHKRNKLHYCKRYKSSSCDWPGLHTSCRDLRSKLKTLDSFAQLARRQKPREYNAVHWSLLLFAAATNFRLQLWPSSTSKLVKVRIEEHAQLVWGTRDLAFVWSPQKSACPLAAGVCYERTCFEFNCNNIILALEMNIQTSKITWTVHRCRSSSS